MTLKKREDGTSRLLALRVFDPVGDDYRIAVVIALDDGFHLSQVDPAFGHVQFALDDFPTAAVA